MTDLLQNYEDALDGRAAVYADYQTHLNTLAQLEQESSDCVAEQEAIEHALNRYTDPDEGQRLLQRRAVCRERLDVVQTALKRLNHRNADFSQRIGAAEHRCHQTHNAILDAEYQRIADSIRPRVVELFALAELTKHPNTVWGGKFAGLAAAFDLKPQDAAALEPIVQRLGIPAKAPKAA